MSYFTRFFISASLGVSPRKPFTWLHPVMPGFMQCRTMYSSICLEYSSVCFTMCGRGPTMLMSPISTFRNCGISSRLVFRIMCPHFVIRASVRVACRVSASALALIVRNFIHRNVLPLHPVRFCTKKSLPGIVDSVIMATIMTNTGNKVQRNTSEQTKSNARFSNRFPRQSNGDPQEK